MARHIPNEHGDCPHWCAGCRSERIVREAVEAPRGPIAGPDQRDRETRGQLARDIAHVLNCHGIDNAMDTPDFLLGDFVVACLEAQYRLKLRDRSSAVDLGDDS